MASEPPPVFAFAADGEAIVFSSSKAAAGWIEAIDVRDGEYEALFAIDGRKVSIGTTGDTVHVTLTQERDDVAFQRYLALVVGRENLSASPSDPVAVANELLRREWEQRWPQRPRWLARRLHGRQPPRA
jgi:hypothetical protein